jgi:hypothetical protein
MSERDLAAIASWQRGEAPDPGRSGGQATRFRCLQCGWRGSGYPAQAAHFAATEHRIVWDRDPRQRETQP